MHKVNTAYSLNDPRKFESIEEAEKELNRLRALCIRLKKKQAEEVHFLLGLSINTHEFLGYMGYVTPKNKGGKKQFIYTDAPIRHRDRETGEIIRYIPDTTVAPHLHIMVDGYGASSCAERILESMRKQRPDCKFSKQHLKTAERVSTMVAYIEEQSTILRRV